MREMLEVATPSARAIERTPSPAARSANDLLEIDLARGWRPRSGDEAKRNTKGNTKRKRREAMASRHLVGRVWSPRRPVALQRSPNLVLSARGHLVASAPGWRGFHAAVRTVAIVGDGDTLLCVTEEKEVVFLIDGRRQAMPVADAKGLLSYLVERTLPAQSLQYKSAGPCKRTAARSK